MVPPNIQSNLASLRMRERMLAFAWGAACWLAVVLLLLLVACLVDWVIDQDRETPFGVRFALFIVQAVIAGVGALLLIVLPQIRRLPDTTLALWVEEKIRKFDHRLISAVQFNQPGADLGGMSAELVSVVTKEAEKEAQRVGFAQVADHRRLKWSMFALVPVLLVVAVPVGIWPGVAFALLARQALLPIDVPHSVELESVSPEVWPIGDTIPLRYRVKGKFNADLIGSVWVTPEGQTTDRYDLTFIREDQGDAIFGADVHPSSSNIRYSARLADGRTKYPSEMTLVARPVVRDNLAWTVLPVYCDSRPNVKVKKRYEIQQGRGDVVGIPGSAIKVRFEVDNLEHKAWLVPLEAADPATRPDEGTPLVEKETKLKIPMTIKKITRAVKQDGKEAREEIVVAEASFDLTENLTGYRMVVQNEYGFDNRPPPRRSVRLAPEDPPQVNLLRDTFGLGSTASFDLEGLPVRLGKKIRIPYACFGPYGLGKAVLQYRVLKKHESGNDPVQEERWISYPLTEYQPDASAGNFDIKTGVFQNTPFDRAVEFHAIPSFAPDFVMGRTQGGGMVLLKTDGLLDSNFKSLALKSGDQVEYCVVVYAAERLPAGTTPFTRSETRVATVLDRTAWENWLTQVGREDERVRQLELREKAVFGPNQ